jgi:hypothetical protein
MKKKNSNLIFLFINKILDKDNKGLFEFLIFFQIFRK